MSKDPGCIIDFSPRPPHCEDVIYHGVPVPSALILIVPFLVALLLRKNRP